MGLRSWLMSGQNRYGSIEDAEAIGASQCGLDLGMNCVDTGLTTSGLWQS